MADIKRLNYFNSQFLIDRDFRDEQSYHLSLRRMHNRVLHRWGVGEGLNVTKTGTTEVTVSQGMAIDAAGNELVLPDPRVLNLAGSTPNTDVFVTISYEEISDPADLYTSGSLREYTRRTERPRVQKATTAPLADGAVLVLARVRLDASGAVSTIEPNARRNASSVVAPETDLQVRSLTLMRQEMPSAQWVRLDLDAANRAKFVAGSLGFEGGREIYFEGNGQLRAFDATHRIFFNRSANQLELHEWGDTIFLNGGGTTPSPERMRVTASGNVGIRDPRAGARLSVGGADATTTVETAEVLRLFRPGVTNTKYVNSAGLFVGAFEPGMSGGSRLDIRLSNTAAAGNDFGYVPNVSVMSLLANGNVGIGVTNPITPLHLPPQGLQLGASATVSENFHLTSDLNGPRGLRLYNGNYGSGSLLLTVLPNGRVGLGVDASNPQAPLQLGKLAVIGSGLTANGTWTNIGSNVHFDGAAWRRIDTTKAAASFHLNGDGGGQEFRFFRVEANGANERNIAVIGSQVTYFNEGNVGVGTGAPAAKLHVVGGAIMPAVGNSQSAGIQFPSNPGGGGFDEAFIRYFVESGETTRLLIGIENDADDSLGFWQAGGERMNIINGNVAIGTRTTAGKLHVNGNANTLALEGSDHSYVAFFPTTFAQGRKAWMGFGIPGQNTFNIINEATGGTHNGRIHIDGADAVYVLNAEGLIVSRAWRGGSPNSGRLIVEGESRFNGETRHGGTRTDINGYDGAGNHWVRESSDENKMWFAYQRSGPRGRNLEIAVPIYVRGQFISSDARLKADIRPLGGVLDKLALIRGVSFEEVETGEEPRATPARRRLGVVAQELEAVFPELVSDTDGEGYKAVAYHGLTGVLIEAGKELRAENDALRQRVEALEKLVGERLGG